MAFNLVDSVKNLFSNDLVSKAASALGENEGGIQKALSGTVPSVLTGFLNKAESSNGAQSLLDLAKQAGSSGILSNLGGLLEGGGKFSGLLSLAGSLFGDRSDNISSLISGFSGIKQSSASSLLNMVAPAALGSLGKYASENNLDASGIASFLAKQKDSILSAIPSGLNLAGALGLGSLSAIGSIPGSVFSGAEDNAAHAVHAAQTTAKKSNWMLPIILAVLAFALLLYLFKSCGSNTIQTPAADSVASQPAETRPAAMEPVRESIKVKLPDNTEIDAYKGGIEDMLVTYLISDEAVSKDKWFDFDDLNFETGSSTVTAASSKQVANIAAILKAFPSARIKIGGYTDNTGDSAANVKLSQARADAVLEKLKASGTDAKQLAGAEGYGPTHFVAPNDTEENKMKNRRISINVREK
jgi:outer membrane protein OmpA-like peptidoglycan-associated protein